MVSQLKGHLLDQRQIRLLEVLLPDVNLEVILAWIALQTVLALIWPRLVAGAVRQHVPLQIRRLGVATFAESTSVRFFLVVYLEMNSKALHPLERGGTETAHEPTFFAVRNGMGFEEILGAETLATFGAGEFLRFAGGVQLVMVFEVELILEPPAADFAREGHLVGMGCGVVGFVEGAVERTTAHFAHVTSALIGLLLMVVQAEHGDEPLAADVALVRFRFIGNLIALEFVGGRGVQLQFIHVGKFKVTSAATSFGVFFLRGIRVVVTFVDGKEDSFGKDFPAMRTTMLLVQALVTDQRFASWITTVANCTFERSSWVNHLLGFVNLDRMSCESFFSFKFTAASAAFLRLCGCVVAFVVILQIRLGHETCPREITCVEWVH